MKQSQCPVITWPGLKQLITEWPLEKCYHDYILYLAVKWKKERKLDPQWQHRKGEKSHLESSSALNRALSDTACFYVAFSQQDYKVIRNEKDSRAIYFSFSSRLPFPPHPLNVLLSLRPGQVFDAALKAPHGRSVSRISGCWLLMKGFC